MLTTIFTTVFNVNRWKSIAKRDSEQLFSILQHTTNRYYKTILR